MLKPTPQEVLFLEKSYNSFLDIYNEVSQDPFWDKNSYYRLSKGEKGSGAFSQVVYVGTFPIFFLFPAIWVSTDYSDPKSRCCG